MGLNLKERKSEGFTIIEVLIVLAIAGLIMVVVFLAVPALQRSGRNNAANANANNLLSAMGTYSSNNGGAIAGTAAISGTSVVLSPSSGTANNERVKVDASLTGVSLTSTIPTTVAPGVYTIVTRAICNDTSTGAVVATNGRAYVVLYGAESGSGDIVKCVGS